MSLITPFRCRVGVVGFGGVGQELCRQIVGVAEVLKSQGDMQPGVSMIADSSGGVATKKAAGFSLEDLDKFANGKKAGKTLKQVFEETQLNDAIFSADAIKAFQDSGEMARKYPILADCSASGSTFKDCMEPLLNSGNGKKGIVMANKKPVSGPMADWQRLMACEAGIESTVGAGLPVLASFTRVHDSGDVVQSIEGQLSGTLGYVLSGLEDGKRFSEIVREAKSMGYTEPDPRDDLSGTDVGRKALILARTIGQELELSDIPIEALYPDSFASLSLEEFMERLPELDDEVNAKVESAKSKGKKLRYAATIQPGNVKVGLTEVDPSSPLGGLRGTANLISITTKYYEASNPLVVKGPGAGLEVTAAGVLGDIALISRKFFS